MQYSVRLQGLLETRANIEVIAMRLRVQIAELEDCIRALKRQSCMDGVLAALRRERNHMLEQLQKLLTMAQCLSRIYRAYKNMENRILNDLEEDYERFEINTGVRTIYSVKAIINPAFFYVVYNSAPLLKCTGPSSSATNTSNESNAYISVQLSD